MICTKAVGKFIVAAIISLGLMPAHAGFKEGLTAYEKKDYQTALKEWRPLADSGDADAQLKLCLMYQRGRGAPRDDRLAFDWCRKAAVQGDAEAQFNLGYMYGTGRGVMENERLSVEWFRKAAEQGHAHAQGMLGNSYKYGLGGVPSNLVVAYALYNIAAANGSETSAINRKALESTLSAQELSTAKRLSTTLANSKSLLAALDAFLK